MPTTGLNLKNAVDDENFVNSIHCAASVGANLFAHNTLFGRMNSPLRAFQLRFLG